MCHKNVTFVLDVFFQALNTPKLIFGQGSAPNPAGGAGSSDSLLSSGVNGLTSYLFSVAKRT